MKKMIRLLLIISIVLVLAACSDFIDTILEDSQASNEHDGEAIVTSLADLKGVEIFQKGALEHILEGELNGKGSAVGFHYDRLPTKKGEIIDGTQSSEDSHGVYEAKVKVDDVEKTSNRGRSTFFPDDWDSQDVVDAIHEAYENREFIQGNTYEGLTDEGIVVQMYLNHQEKIISAFPVYEGD